MIGAERDRRRRMCGRKIGYRTAAAAWKVCRQMWIDMRERLHAYRCPYSKPGRPHYHVGHSSRGR